MALTARAALLAAGLCVVPVVAAAQEPAPTAAPAATSTVAAPAATDPGAAAETSAPSAKPSFPATGYGWSTTPPKRVPHGPAHPGRARAHTGPDVVLPGFETLADGSSRLFVQLSKPATFDTKQGAGGVTVVLKGVHVDRRNNTNPLVTVHFNTPVTAARLVPHGHDLWFVVDLRAKVQPAVTMDAAKDGAAMLRIEFPKGDYLPAEAGEPVSSGARGSATPASTEGPRGAAAAPARLPRAGGGGRRHRGGASTQSTP